MWGRKKKEETRTYKQGKKVIDEDELEMPEPPEVPEQTPEPEQDVEQEPEQEVVQVPKLEQKEFVEPVPVAGLPVVLLLKIDEQGRVSITRL